MSCLEIIVPTRNRESEALICIKNLVKIARATDALVTVSDNSDVKSEAIARACSDFGFEYISQKSTLSMAQHWNALIERAQGENITFVTDRSYMLLEQFLRAFNLCQTHKKAVSYQSGTFIKKSFFKIPMGVLSSARYTGRVYSLRASDLIYRMIGNIATGVMPKLLNSIIPISEIHSVIEKFGAACDSNSPDYEFGYKYLFLDKERDFIHYDSSVFYTFAKNKSNSGGFDGKYRNSSALDFINLNNLASLEYSPVPDNFHSFSAASHEFNRISYIIDGVCLIDKAGLEASLAQRDLEYSKRNKLVSLLTLLGAHPRNALYIRPYMQLSDITEKLAKSREKDMACNVELIANQIPIQ